LGWGAGSPLFLHLQSVENELPSRLLDRVEKILRRSALADKLGARGFKVGVVDGV
jgi:hypothetical protein